VRARPITGVPRNAALPRIRVRRGPLGHHGPVIPLSLSLLEGLVRLWSEVLEVPDVDEYDDFFNLGGNSLRAVRMLAEISRLTNLEVSTRVLYENPTPASFHARLHE
jgi:hypothetical protein